MSTLELSRFREINAIIERDSKNTTYKFALIEARSEEITGYWTLLDQAYPRPVQTGDRRLPDRREQSL